MAEIGKIYVDFQVLKTYDPKVILVADSSDWKHIEDKVSFIEVTMPGARIPASLPFTKGKINILNSSILGITPKACSTDELKFLPDGMYKIKVKGSPDSFFREKYYLRTEQLQLELDKLYVSLGVDFTPDNKELRDKLYDIDLMLKAAESSTRLGDIAKASAYYKEAKNLYRYYTDCVDC